MSSGFIPLCLHFIAEKIEARLSKFSKIIPAALLLKSRWLKFVFLDYRMWTKDQNAVIWWKSGQCLNFFWLYYMLYGNIYGTCTVSHVEELTGSVGILCLQRNESQSFPKTMWAWLNYLLSDCIKNKYGGLNIKKQISHQKSAVPVIVTPKCSLTWLNQT